MKFFLLITLLCVLKNSAFANSYWEEYKLKFNKNYEPSEDNYHKEVFYRNIETIIQHNERYLNNQESYKMGINQFTDLTFEERAEFGNSFLTRQRPITRAAMPLTHKGPIPEHTNWVERGAVTPVKDQGRCASCYAFGSTVVFEAQYFLKTGNLRNLSEQNLLDCAPNNLGCTGGFIEECFEYVHGEGIKFEEDYEYRANVSEACGNNRGKSVFPLKDFFYIESGDEEAITRMIATVGPVAVALDDRHFHHYAGGILDNTQGCNETNHVVALVGYGVDAKSGQEYYLAKNSWGRRWGEDGYARIARNVNYCLITESAVSALL